MKKLFLLLVILLNYKTVCIDPYDYKKHQDKIKDCEKFIYRMRLQAPQLYHLAKECKIEHNVNSCNEIQTTKKTLKEGVRIHGQVQSFLVYDIIFLHEAYSFNRQELYEQDLDLLERYKQLLPEELYSLLSDFEKESALTRNECVFKHNTQACKKSFDRSTIQKEVMEKLTEL